MANDNKEIERSSFRQEIQDYEREHKHWDALVNKFEDKNLKGFKCPHCGKKTMAYLLRIGSYIIRCNDCMRFVERRGKPDWAKTLPQNESVSIE